MLTESATRVEQNTDGWKNRKIREHTIESLRQAAALGPAGLERRLRELDREWDIERLLEANASTITLVGVLLGAFHHPAWLLLPALVASMLLLHALQGWCPPVPLFRRLGVRTPREIETERAAAKALRGDFVRVEGASAASALQAAE